MAFDLEDVAYQIEGAKGIAFDGCHKIYVLMDDEQMSQMKAWGYDPLISASEMSETDMAHQLQEWYEESCGLRFIEKVSTHPTDPNLGFETIIGQGEDSDEEDED